MRRAPRGRWARRPRCPGDRRSPSASPRRWRTASRASLSAPPHRPGVGIGVRALEGTEQRLEGAEVHARDGALAEVELAFDADERHLVEVVALDEVTLALVGHR